MKNHKINTKCIMTLKKKKSNELLMVTIWRKKKLLEKNNMKKLHVYALKLLPSLSKF